MRRFLGWVVLVEIIFAVVIGVARSVLSTIMAWLSHHMTAISSRLRKTSVDSKWVSHAK
jgi:hypothetical protein